MIIEVAIGAEEPRRYQLRRDGERVVLRQVDTDDGDGAEVVIDWRRPRPGVYSLLIDDRSYEVFLEEEPDHLAVHLVRRTYEVRAADVRRHRRALDAAGVVDGPVRITAPIPGRVARVLVQPGQEVVSGDGIVVVEAMKMENELRAPRDGVVEAVEVAEGDGVEGGALLVTIQ